MKNLISKNKQLILATITTLLICGLTAAAQTVEMKPEVVQSPPANDSFANAQLLGDFGSISGTTLEATKEAGEPNHAGKQGGRSVWFKWTQPSTVTFSAGYTFTLRNSTTNFDTLLAIYTGSSVNALTQISANDDYGSTPTSLTSTVFFPTTPGTTYYIAIDGHSGASGNFTLSWGINRTHADSSQFSGTSQSVVSVFRPSNGTWYVNALFGGFRAVQFGQSGDIPVPADYDGDQLTDYAVFRPSNGAWYVLQSRTGTVRGVIFGQNGDKPVPGDYTANGFADFAVFRPSTGTWYVLESRTNQFIAAQFGQSGDKPAVRDYDADGKLDFTVYRPSNGTWYILNSLDNSFKAVQFGTNEDIPVPGGYAVTGRADIAVWRPSNGTWYVYFSHNNQFLAKPFGQSGDIPQPINYGNNVGLSDFGVYRPSTGTWYIQDGYTNQFWAIPFGTSGDIPTATAYPIQQSQSLIIANIPQSKSDSVTGD
jgi:hypothetical protein